MGTPQYTLNSSKLWQSQGTEGVNNLTASDDPNIYSSESAQKPVHIQSDHENCDHVSEPVIEIKLDEDLSTLVIQDNVLYAHGTCTEFNTPPPQNIGGV